MTKNDFSDTSQFTGCVQFCWQFVIAIQQNELNDIKVCRTDWYSKFSVKEIHRNIEHSKPVIFSDNFYVLIGVFIYKLEWTSSLWHCVRIRIRDGSLNNSCGKIFPMKIPRMLKLNEILCFVKCLYRWTYCSCERLSHDESF